MKHRRNRSFIFNCCFNRLTNRKLNDDHRSRLKKKWRSANKNLKLRPVVAIDRHVSGWIRFDFVLNFSWFFVFFFGGGGVERAATTLWQLSPGRTRSNGGAETPTGPLTPAPRHRSHLFFVCWPVFAFGFSCVFGLFCCFLYFFLGHINQTEKKCLPECVCVWNYVSSRSCLASARWHYCRNIGNQNFPPRCEELWVCVCVCVCWGVSAIVFCFYRPLDGCSSATMLLLWTALWITTGRLAAAAPSTPPTYGHAYHVNKKIFFVFYYGNSVRSLTSGIRAESDRIKM